MKQQVILNFLNLPGIVGVGLIDGHSRPYFSGIDRSLNFQQKEALTQGIQQVISTIPAGFQSFDFRFAQQDAWIYKLSNGVILLVVTDHQLDTLVYNDTVNQLKETLESDPHSAVSTFRLLAGSTTLNRPADSDTADTPTPQRKTAPAPISSSPAPRDQLPAAIAPCQWPDCIAALNALTDATAKYLGKIVVANTWRSTCPDKDNLQYLQVDRSGHFSLSSNGNEPKSGEIADADYKLICKWVQKFIQRCSMIIRDYAEMVLMQGLSAQQRGVLQIKESE